MTRLHPEPDACSLPGHRPHSDSGSKGEERTDMKKNRFLTLAISTLLAFAVANAPAQQSPSEGIPVQVVVTVEPHKGKEPPVINREDVMVHEGRDRDRVVDWIPAQRRTRCAGANDFVGRWIEHHAGYAARRSAQLH